MTNEVSIIIRVNDSEAEKLRKTAEAARLAASQIAAASSQAARQQEVDAARVELAHSRALVENVIREKAAADQLNRIHAAAFAEDLARERAQAEAINRIHATAIAEDIAREKARTAAILREREKSSLLGNAATGALSAAGFGFGANALGAGLAAGTGIIFSSQAAQELERAQRSIAAVTGSLATAQSQMDFVRRQADRLGVSVTSLAAVWARFGAAAKGTNLEGAKSRDVFLAVTEAAARLNLRGEETEGALRAIEQMMSKGTVQAEELRGQLGDRLPGAFNIMARALGVTTTQLGKMLQQGQVLADDALPKFAAELRKTFDTDVNTRIDTTTASFTRLWNEIKLTAAAVGNELNPVLAKGAEGAAESLRNLREFGQVDWAKIARDMPLILQNPALAAKEFQDVLNRADQAARRASDREQNQAALGTIFQEGPLRSGGTFNVGAIVPKVPEDNRTGLSLLTSGQAPRSQKDLNEIETLQREIALTGKKTELEKVQWEIEKGKYRDADAYVQSLAIQAAKAKDLANTEKDAAKEKAKDQKEADRFAEADLRRELRKEEFDRKTLRDQVTQNALDAKQLELGRNLTDSEREQIKLAYEEANVSGTTLDIEVKKGIELERQILARRKIVEEANKAAQFIKTQSASDRNAKRDLNNARSVREVDAIESDRIDAAKKADDERIAALTKERETQLDVNKNYDQLEADSHEIYEEEKTRITRESAEARSKITQEQANVVSGIFGNLAEVAQGMGKKGFKAYKEFAIAQATASMFQGAVGAFAQASAAFPPPFGQVLGAAAAAAVVAAGLSQIAQIKALTYQGGRRFGGPVSAGSLYEVAEGGAPEMYHAQDGRVWMIPGADGRVTPAKAAADVAQSRGSMNVRVVNPPGMPLQARSYVERDELVVMLEDATNVAASVAEERISNGLLKKKGRFGPALSTATGARLKQSR